MFAYDGFHHALNEENQKRSEDDRNIDAAKATMDRIGNRLISEAKRFWDATGEKEGSVQARDLLSLLIKANMDASIPESQRLSDFDVLAREPASVRESER